MALPSHAKMVRLPVISLFLLVSPLWAGEDVVRNNDAEMVLGRMNRLIHAMRQQAQIGSHRSDFGALSALLSELETAVAQDAQNRVHTKGVSVELEAVNEVLFTHPPRLPAEQKVNGGWQFDTIRLQVAPRYLYVYGVRFKGSHTIRLRQVTLKFRDGGPDVIHNHWLDLEEGDGQAFDKRTFTPVLAAWRDDEAKRARPLEAIEILGSAQDGRHESDLEFLVEVPTPEARPHQKTPEILAQLRKKWESLDSADVTVYQLIQEDLEALSHVLSD